MQEIDDADVGAVTMEEQVGAPDELPGGRRALERPHARRADRPPHGRRPGTRPTSPRGPGSARCACGAGSGSSSPTGWNVSRPTASSTRWSGRAGRRDPGQHLGREVQPGGRRGGRAGQRGVHGLVAIGAIEAFVDVRRQGHLADLVEQRQRLHRSGQLDVERVAGLRAGADDDHRAAVGREQLLACVELAGRAHQRLPVATAGILRLEQEHLRAPPPVARCSRSRAGITLVSLTTTTSPGAQEAREVGDGAVLGRRAAPVDQQPGGVAWLDRHLGDPVRRQLVVELLQPHRPRRLRTLAPIRGFRCIRGFRAGLARARDPPMGATSVEEAG